MKSVVGNAFNNKKFIMAIAEANADILFRAKSSRTHYWNETLAVNFNRALMNVLCSKSHIEHYGLLCLF